MMLAPTKGSYIQDSRLMSTELANMGYNDLNRKKQREIILTTAECHNIFERALNTEDQKCFFPVGSQIEGTALRDSDDDKLLGPPVELVAAIRNLSEENAGRVNILIVRNKMSPPGHAWLKLLINRVPKIVTKSLMLQIESDIRFEIQYKLYSQFYIPSVEVPDVEEHLIYTWPGTLLLDDSDLKFYIPNSLYTLIGIQFWAGKASRTGPSFSYTETDVVRPIFCDNIFPRNQDPITIGGTLYGNLEVPKEYPCNFVPVGHPESENAMLEWRISYNLTEREIIFGFNNTQIQTYVVLKMLQRSYFKQYVGNILTSYHCKTSLYHTIASSVTTIWKEDNLINCVRQCLNTVRMFLKKRFCPHFFNKSFNIFNGKLPRCGNHWGILIELVDYLVAYPKTYLQCIETEKEKLFRIQSLPIENHEFVLRCVTLVDQINSNFVFLYNDIETFAPNIRLDDIRKTRLIYKKFLRKVEYQIEHAPCSQQTICAEVVLSFAKVRHYLLSAAYFLKQGKQLNPPVPENILPDALSMDLLFSSLMLENGDYEKCRLLLGRVFLKISTCPIFYIKYDDNGRHLSGSDFSEFFSRYKGSLPVTDIPAWTFIKCYVSLQVIFLVHEICLLHPLLRFEAYRFIFEDRRNMCSFDDKWRCTVRLDYIPFLFFMQYLVYKELGHEEHKHEALVRLEVCIDYSFMSYPHIAMNMLGICCESERNYNKAFRCYARSLEKLPRFNAAIFHIALLVWKFWVRHNVEIFQSDIFFNVLNIVD